MKKCFAVAISILIILMSCSEHKKVEKVLTWEDSVDMALKGYVYLNYPDSSDFLIRNRKVAYRNDSLCIVFVDAITNGECVLTMNWISGKDWLKNGRIFF